MIRAASILVLSAVAALAPVPALSASYLQATPDASFNVTTSGFTVEAWVKVRTKPGPDPRIIRCIGPTEGPCGNAAVDVWELWICSTSCAAGRVYFGVQHGGVCAEVQSSAVVDTAFHHVAGTYGGDSLKIYIDGVRSGALYAPAWSVQVAGGKLVVGNATAYNNAYDGLIDEVRVWNVARTEGQISSSMLGEVTPGAGLVGYWRLNGDGTDLVAGRTLVPTGSVSFVAGKINQAADVCNQVTCPPPPPPVVPPSCSATDASDAGVTFTWADVAFDEGYRVFRNTAQVGSVGPNVTTFVDTPPPGTYTYCVEAFNTAGVSPQCCDSGTRLVPPAPPTPSPCSASDGSFQNVFITWANVANEDGYRVFRNGVQIASLAANVVSTVDTPPFGTYTYCVEAFNAGGASPQCCDSGTRSPAAGPGLGAFQLAALLASLGVAGILAMRQRRPRT